MDCRANPHIGSEWCESWIVLIGAQTLRFGSTALKVHDKIFAMVSSQERFVVKLPKARVDALVGEGAGQRFDAIRGEPMREWFHVHSESGADWLELAGEALDLVGT